MLKKEFVEISINNRNKNYFNNLGYSVATTKNDTTTLVVKIKDLTKNSRVEVDVVCDICKKEYSLMYCKYLQNISHYGFFTCKKCSNEKKKITNLKRYGVENCAKLESCKYSIKQTKLEKYGDENYNNANKRKETCLDKYGVNYTFNHTKIRKTKLEKYGNEYFLNFEKTKKTKLEKYEDPYFTNPLKRVQTNLEKYGVDNYTKTVEFKKKLWEYYNNKLEKKLNVISINRTENNATVSCDKNHEYTIPLILLYNRLKIKTEPCLICNPINSYSNSGYEIQLQNYIKENYKKEIIFNNKKIINNEIDIYIPELKLAFEFNGVYWHNELNVTNNYHLNKTEECEKQGIKLIQIYEDDWIYKQEIIKSRILNLIGKSNKIYARKCDIKEINDNKIIKEFLEKNHLQGNVGSKVKIGLFYQEKLVSLMTFGSQRKSMGQKSKDGFYEMLRFCNKLNTNVIGGASRLFKYFIENYKINVVISYADRSWSSGNLYEKLGFKLEHKTCPNYYYVIGNKRFYRFNFRKDKLIQDGFDPNKTEREIMLERKIYRIYDSGQLKYIFKTS